MQPWHSVLLIIITLIVFGAGFYYDQIEKNTAAAYEESLMKTREEIAQKQDSNISSEIQSSTILEKSSAWAETKIFIELPSNNDHFLYLHQEAIKGDVFLASIIKTLDKNPTAKEVCHPSFFPKSRSLSAERSAIGLVLDIRVLKLPTFDAAQSARRRGRIRNVYITYQLRWA